MPGKHDRRSFLKASLAAAGAAVAAGLPRPRAAGADSGKELCTLLDIRKCIGCEACVDGCRDVNGFKYPEPEGDAPVMYPVKRVKIADWSPPEKRAVNHRLTPYNWLYIQTAEGEFDGKPFSLYIPRRCMHCRNAPCVNLCPFGAAFKQANGVVRFHDQICMGGAKCKIACPWRIPERQSGVGSYLNVLPNFAGNGVMYKCDRCYNRVAAGELPACIEVCPENVQTIGPRREILAKARKLAEKIGGFIYGEKENGGSNTIYVSPVPFETLNKVIEKGPGQPHLKAVDDAMADVNMLAGALIAAPAAGVIGAALRLKRLTDSDANTENGGRPDGEK
ncbi:MAG: 4Fe-4S dicluster domain-containing protein [Desulfobacterales bacterium]|nr:4Fe-4S dicluster domain-containing protein [Desulfobacterales bacterium]